jgi:hypothetical protein
MVEKDFLYESASYVFEEEDLFEDIVDVEEDLI